MQHTIDKVGAVDKVFAVNHRRGSDFKTTVQNNTGAVINLTYTNDRIQFETPVFGALTGAPTTVAAGALECIECPMTGINFAGTGTGTIDIVEAG